MNRTNTGEKNKFVPSEYREKVGVELTGMAGGLLITRLLNGREGVQKVVDQLAYNKDGTRSNIDVLSALPIRPLTDGYTIMSDFSLPLAFWGDRWNFTNKSRDEAEYALEVAQGLWKKFTSQQRDNDFDSQRPLDFIAFPPEGITDEIYRNFIKSTNGLVIQAESWNRALDINTRLFAYYGHRGFVEIGSSERSYTGMGNNKLLRNPQEVLEESVKYQAGIAYDTLKMRKGVKPLHKALLAKKFGISEESLDIQLGVDWQKEINDLLKATGMLHFQPSSKKELDLTLTENSELYDQVTAIKELGFKGPVIIEYGFSPVEQLNTPSMIDQAKDIADWLKENLYDQDSSKNNIAKL